MDCARCGADAHRRTRKSFSDDGYAYCEECFSLFESIEENEVYVYWVANRAGAINEVYLVNDPDGSINSYHKSQVGALAAAKGRMQFHDCRGLFEYHRSGSRWLVSEYLDTHPEIAEGVAAERRGFLEKLKNRFF